MIYAPALYHTATDAPTWGVKHMGLQNAFWNEIAVYLQTSRSTRKMHGYY